MSTDKGLRIYLVPSVTKSGETFRVYRGVFNGQRIVQSIRPDLAEKVLKARAAGQLVLSGRMSLWNVKVDGQSDQLDDAYAVNNALMLFPELASEDSVISSSNNTRVQASDASVGKVYVVNNGEFAFVYFVDGASRLLTPQELAVLMSYWSNWQFKNTAQRFGHQTYIAECCRWVTNASEFLPRLPKAVKLGELTQAPHQRMGGVRQAVQQEIVPPTPPQSAAQKPTRPEEYSPAEVARLHREASNYQALVGSGEKSMLPTIPKPEEVTPSVTIEPVKLDDHALARMAGLVPDGEDLFAGLFGLDQAVVDAIPSARGGQDKWTE